MDSNSEDREHPNIGHTSQHEQALFRVRYSHQRNANKVNHDKNEMLPKKRAPAGRSGNTPSRFKRVVSCKRKNHYLTMARRKQFGPGRTCNTTNKENERMPVKDAQQELYNVDIWDFPPNVNNEMSGGTDPEQTECFLLAELAKDHRLMTDVLFGRHLRLKVALTLWKRNVGELLTYFLSIDEDSSSVTIGCCVDLFPLVKEVLTWPYEEYLVAGLRWIQSVLRNWREELQASRHTGLTNNLSDRNFTVFSQQLLELWYREPFLKSVPGTAGEIAKDIDSFLSRLT
ncbi:KATNB1-like protein 1 isoform X2 [Thalassophryne amazonica]|uniref:KATNB1-like protein 1 isoform X2 n=1 Tax=Thalassophryne amazonica TaxID=390379 RepID=UPI001471B191|nr:KATNB1-like protein 1 isoform X2 [Thalassophryne amazonica]